MLVELPCKHIAERFTMVNVTTTLRPPILVTPFFKASGEEIRRFTIFYNAHTFEMMHVPLENQSFEDWDQVIVVAHSSEHHTLLCDIEESDVESLIQILTQFGMYVHTCDFTFCSRFGGFLIQVNEGVLCHSWLSLHCIGSQ